MSGVNSTTQHCKKFCNYYNVSPVQQLKKNTKKETDKSRQWNTFHILIEMHI
jgi:hypothetical protein